MTLQSEKITRPLLRYHGGKFLLAKWIISHFPEHRIYVEPYGGAASVLLRKPRSYAEVYNDLDNEIVNLFMICWTKGNELIEALYYTPFSRKEFELSYELTDDLFEKARRTVIRSFMGFGSNVTNGRKTGFRSNSNRSGNTPSNDWKNYNDALPVLINRMRGIVIENRNAIEVIKAHDSKRTLLYLDPPYVLRTRYKREKTKCYNFEMTDEQHETLCKEILQLKGMVIISGYDNELYNDLLPWKKVYKKSFADGAAERREVLWISPSCGTNKLLIAN